MPPYREALRRVEIVFPVFALPLRERTADFLGPVLRIETSPVLRSRCSIWRTVRMSSPVRFFETRSVRAVSRAVAGSLLSTRIGWCAMNRL